MTNSNYTVDEVLKALIELPAEEKGILTKSLSVDRLTEIGNSVKLFQDYCSASTCCVRDWKNFKSGLEDLMIALKNNKEINENEVFLGISKELFEKMVSVVADVTQKSYETEKSSLYAILERLSKIRTFKDAVKMLEIDGIGIKRNLFDMLTVIGANWKSYSDVVMCSTAKSIAGERAETFIVLMENWNKVTECVETDNITINENVSIMENFESGLNKLDISLYVEPGKSRSFRDVLDDVAESYDGANEEERQSIEKLLSGSVMG